MADRPAATGTPPPSAATPPPETGGDGGWFVKHPHGGGGTGTTFASDTTSAVAAVAAVLAGECAAALESPSPAAVLQRAVGVASQATLPKGPSRIELRVHALFRRRDAMVFSGMRVKTAAIVGGGSALNNKKVQQASDTWGAFYPNNSLDAVGPGLGCIVALCDRSSISYRIR
jgi:hypothetical protein